MTLQEAQNNLMLWREAEQNIAVLGQSYKIADRVFTFADMKYINGKIAYFENQIAVLSGRRRRGVRMQSIIPVDL
jgi:hypothetical protein